MIWRIVTKVVGCVARGEAMLCTVDVYAPPKNPKNSGNSQIYTIYASPKFYSYAPTRDVHPLIFCSSFVTVCCHIKIPRVSKFTESDVDLGSRDQDIYMDTLCACARFIEIHVVLVQ
jgi:hypothetical protein